MAELKLVVFDLDFTLWDCGGTWCDHLSPPFRLRDDRVCDRYGAPVRFYNDVWEILDHLDDEGIAIALASRTSEPGWARELLELLDAAHRFPHQEIFPDEKTTHFANLQDATSVAYSEMLFFDDERRNIDAVGTLGVECVYVRSGVSWDAFEQGAARFGLTTRL